jgi:crotonobetainyl-CoA:carnitine CoA-transferase CaiB-like acyl-CoA transferase
MPGPLQGVRVLDLTSVVMGPYATQILGDYGAEVIKVEPPEGDVMRLSGPMRNPGMGHLYMNVNRNKRSIVLDLKQPVGKEVALVLAQRADVLVYNLRPQAIERLGLSYEDVRAVNPRIIYAGAFGFSQRGPYAARPAYDDLIQGMSGIPWLSQQAGAAVPRYAPMILADRLVGVQLVAAITSALFHRERTGRGQRIDVPMYEGFLSVVLGEHLAGRMFDPPLGEVGYQRSLARDRRPYPTSDGYICALIYTDKHWRRFFDAIGKSEIFERDARFSTHGARVRHIGEVYGFLRDVLVTRTTAEWLSLFGKADIPAARMLSIEDVLADSHLNAIDYFRERVHPSEGRIVELAVPTEWSDSAPELARHAPELGEHTVEILREAGFSSHQIDELFAAGAINLRDTGKRH